MFEINWTKILLGVYKIQKDCFSEPCWAQEPTFFQETLTFIHDSMQLDELIRNITLVLR